MWSLRPVDRRRRTGRGFRAALASLVLPGAGQLMVGRRVKGSLLLVVSLALIGGAAWLATRPTTELAGWVLRPTTLLWLLGINLVILVFRFYATFDAYAEGIRPPAHPVLPRSGWAATAVGACLVVLAAVVVVPHAAVGYYTASTHGVISSVFVADERGEPPVAVSPDERQEEPDEPPSGPSSEDGGLEPPREEADLGEGPSPAPEGPSPAPEEPSPPPANPWSEAGRVTVALLGSDAGQGRSGDRIDSLLVATIDPETGDAALFSVDRYLADFPLPKRLEEVYAEHCPSGEGWEYLLALYRCGDERVPEEFAALYPRAHDPAAAAVADVLGELLGIGVPHYAMVDMGGFVAIVDALGGVEVDLASPLHVRMSPPEPGGEWYTVDLPEGRQELTGEEALAFVRVRERDGGDADRMRRQRCLVTSVVRTADVGTILRGFPDIASAIEDHVTTSIPIDLLPYLIELLPSVDPDRVVAVGFGPPGYRGWDHVPDVERIQQRVRQVLDDPDAALDASDAAETGEAVCR